MSAIRTLSDVCSSIVDCEHKTSPETLDGQFYAVGTPAMRNNLIDYSEARQISAKTFELWTRRLRPRAGDLLLAREAPVGPVVLIPESANVAPGQRTVLLRPDPEVMHSSFLYYQLISPLRQALLNVKAAGSTVAHLNVADVRSFKVAVPSLPEQRAIAEVLGALDDKIAANAQLIEVGAELATSIVNLYLPQVPLANVVKYVKRPVAPEDLSVDFVDHFSLPAFDLNCVPDFVSPRSIKSQKYAVDGPSVLISKLNPRFPRIWDVTDLTERPAVASTEFLVLESRYSSSTVLWAALRQPSFSSELESKVAGTSGSHQRVRPDDLLATHVVDPRLIDAQHQELITTLGAQLWAARDESRVLTSMRDTLLPALMSGRLRVKDAERQVEEVL